MDILEIYNEGNVVCPHSFVYSPYSKTIVKNGLFFETKRVCELCGHFELTLENMKHSKIDNYYELLNNYGLEVR